MLVGSQEGITAKDTVEAALKEIEMNMKGIVSGQSDTYEAGLAIWGRAFSLAGDSKDLMWPMWLIWGALTDWVEVKPNEATTARESMLRAAREWLSLEQSPSERKDYFDRWLFDELGHERPGT